MNKSSIKLKRVYEEAEKSDGFRILVDRLWPRGVSKEKAKIDLWLKEVAPSNELRRWFGHDPAKWPEFQKRYDAELKGNSAVTKLKEILEKEKPATLLFSAKDKEHSNAIALAKILKLDDGV